MVGRAKYVVFVCVVGRVEKGGVEGVGGGKYIGD